MLNGEKFVSSKVAALLSRFTELHGALRPPIDPFLLAKICGIRDIEHRPMVPEGVLAVVEGGFKMYLQDNFTQHPGALRRRRFTVAHEIAHTFFYDVSENSPKRISNCPSARALERLCHSAAAKMLVPNDLLRTQVSIFGEVSSAEHIFELARTFDVSVEVMIRRLQQSELVADSNFAAVLVESLSAEKRVIRSACYGPIFRCIATRPDAGMDFDSWVRQLNPPPNEAGTLKWEYRTPVAVVSGRKVQRSANSFILDLRLAHVAS